MASKALASTALLLSLNLIMMSMVSSTYMTVPSTGEHCPMDALKLGVCVSVLKLVNVDVGSPPTHPCCSLIHGLVDLEAAACLCTALKADVLGIDLDIPLSLSLVLSNCGKSPAFQCA